MRNIKTITWMLLGGLLWHTNPIHAADDAEERPSSACVRKTTFLTEAQQKWAAWTTRLQTAPSGDTEMNEAHHTVIDEIEAYWAGLIGHQLYAQFQAPEAPEAEDSEAEEEYQTALDQYNGGIQEKAKQAAEKAMAPFLQIIMSKKKRHGRRSSVSSVESGMTDLSFGSSAATSRRGTDAEEGKPEHHDTGVGQMKEALFSLAQGLDDLRTALEVEEA